METQDTIVAVFETHPGAENAIKKLSTAGFKIQQLSVIGKGYHTEENVVGFYNAGDRVTFWGSRGAFWGALWGLFFGGLFITTPIIGPVVVLGYLASAVFAGAETALIVGALSAFGAAMFGIGIPKNSVIQYETDLKADNFLVMVHGTPEEAIRVKAILGVEKPSRLDVHTGVKQISPPRAVAAATA